jgi:hypothetical protein
MAKDLDTAFLLGLLKTKLFRDRIFFLLLIGRINGDPTLCDMAERDLYLSCEEFSKH